MKFKSGTLSAGCSFSYVFIDILTISLPFCLIDDGSGQTWYNENDKIRHRGAGGKS